MKYRAVWKLNYSMGVPGKVLAAGLAGASLRRSWDCPVPHRDGSSQFQLVPAGSNSPTTGHRRTPLPGWWHLGESVFKKGEKTPDRQRKRGKK